MVKHTHGTAVRAALRALDSAGEPVDRVYDGTMWHSLSGEHEVMGLVLDLDASYLGTAKGATMVVAPFEDPADQIVDYPVALEDTIGPILARYNV